MSEDSIWSETYEDHDPLDSKVFRIRVRAKDVRNLIIGCRYRLDRRDPIFYNLLGMYRRIGREIMKNMKRNAFLTAKFTYLELKFIDQALRQEIPEAFIGDFWRSLTARSSLLPYS